MDRMNSQVLLIDTFSLLFRAHHALPPMNTSTGAPTSALYGLSTLVLKLVRERRPEALAFAVDAGPSFRREIDAAYKAHRGETPDPLAKQIEALADMFEALGAPALAVPGYEADDVLATLAQVHAGQGASVLVVSGDRDLFQVVGPRVGVLFVGRRGQDHVLYDEAKVDARYGLRPDQLPSFTALTGDTSDNIPKVPGVGPKTASKWLQAYGDVEGLLDHIEALEPARLRETVAEHAERLRTSVELARLRTDVPLPDGPTAAPIDDAALERWQAWFQTWAFESLVKRVDDLRAEWRSE